ncbi:MAG: Cthe_2314 family HEPN domain-containing protein [Ignavibacteriales bacterium]|nr:Cthe_2314 family HEPN domain-containing protein [Ignavibacteriales bacterium]
MDKSTEIVAQPFFKLLLDIFHPITKAGASGIPEDEEKYKEWRRTNRSRLNQGELYVTDVFNNASNLIKVFDRIRYSQYLINRSPKGFLTKDNSNGRRDWTDYHFFVYTTSMASILDCMLMLSAEVYELGLSPRFCTFEIITQHKWIAGSDLVKSLRQLRKTLDPHISRRHRFLHRGEESGFVDLVDEERYIELNSYTFLQEHDHPVIHPRILSLLWKGQLTKIKPLLLTFETSARKNVVSIFGELFPIFKYKLSKYKLLNTEK